MVERLLRMREALGSIPRISILFCKIFGLFKVTGWAICIAQNDESSDGNPTE